MSKITGRSLCLIAAGSIAAISIAAFAASAAAPGGNGSMRGPMRGPMMGGCARMTERLAQMDRHLTTDQVHDIVAGRLASGPERTLKVGKVSEKDGVIDVQIVTKEGSLVTTRSISAKTGLSPDAGKGCERMAERVREMRANRASASSQDAAPGATPDANAGARPNGGRGMRPGMGGPGRMNSGFGPGQRAAFRGRFDGARGGFHEFLSLGIAANAGPGHDLDLSAAQAKTLAEADLVVAGNSRLKVGAVKEKDADTITVDIVTTDNALVVRREIDRHTGRARRAV